jgi:hypothetical protein
MNGMKAAGMDVKTAVESGKPAIISKQEAYLKQGYFDPDWTIVFLKNATDEAKAAGFSALRATGEMTWNLGGDPGTERLMEHEATSHDLPGEGGLAVNAISKQIKPPRNGALQHRPPQRTSPRSRSRAG